MFLRHDFEVLVEFRNNAENSSVGLDGEGCAFVCHSVLAWEAGIRLPNMNQEERLLAFAMPVADFQHLVLAELVDDLLAFVEPFDGEQQLGHFDLVDDARLI